VLTRKEKIYIVHNGNIEERFRDIPLIGAEHNSFKAPQKAKHNKLGTVD
jgi:hypothetical protein